jgi:hypothetical protein
VGRGAASATASEPTSYIALGAAARFAQGQTYPRPYFELVFPTAAIATADLVIMAFVALLLEASG